MQAAIELFLGAWSLVIPKSHCLFNQRNLARIVSIFRLRNKKGGLLLAATRGLPFLAVSDALLHASEDPQP